MGHKSAFSKHGLFVQDVVVAFNIKQKVVCIKPNFVEIIFNNECHVRKGQVDEVSEDYPIVSFIFNPMSILESKRAVFSIEVWNAEVIAFNFAGLPAIDQVVFLCQIRIALSILEEECISIDVKGLNF